VAYRRNWLNRLSYKQSKRWFIAGALAVPFILFAWFEVTKSPFMVVHYLGGFNLRALFLATWEAIVCLGFCYYLPFFFRKYLDFKNATLINMAGSTYFVYFIHPVFVVGATILFEPLSIFPFGKFILSFLLGSVLCFMFAHGIRMVPGVKRIF
jgi:glucan biosynthesis protein C